MSTRSLSGGKGWPVRKAGNLTAICEPCLENVGASTFYNPMDLHGVTGIALPFLIFVIIIIIVIIIKK
jgi:hypothetical protein